VRRATERARRVVRPRFPLGDWIVLHRDVRHQLSQSGMVGALRSVGPALRAARPTTEEELRRLLARRLRIAPERLFLTHGATEANALAMLAVAAAVRSGGRSVPRARVAPPEYPPLRDAAAIAGFHLVAPGRPAELLLLSEPNNPTGLLRGAEGIARERGRTPHLIVDETFREFTSAPSIAVGAPAGTWTTGTLTKAYGADGVRVGWAVAPEEEADRFARLHAQLADGVAATSLAQAAALLARGSGVLRESRALFRRNRARLRRSLPEVPALAAPVWFDRGRGRLPDREVASAALRRGVLVAPGSFFGDPRGVRLCLTRREFPQDLDAYLAVRSRFLKRGRRSGAGSEPRAGSSRR
jgi:aspartate/methionine/tyrosine aminotransferase